MSRYKIKAVEFKTIKKNICKIQSKKLNQNYTLN